MTDLGTVVSHVVYIVYILYVTACVHNIINFLLITEKMIYCNLHLYICIILLF